MGDRVLWAFRHDLPRESDEQLTDRARTGDKSAFGELYRRHRKAAESTAWCMLGSKSDADDVVSDAFAGVLSALRNGRGPRDNFRGYLLACVRNGCRSRRRPTVLVDEQQLDRWSPAVEDPEKYVEADTVARAFSSLAPRWQHTLWMTEVEQLPAAEVSERLDLSPNATAALTHRARQAFAEAYLAEHVGTVTDKDCRRIAPHLPGYVRKQLRDLQLASVEQHLINCERCAAAVADLRDVNASLRSLLPVAPPALAGAVAATQATIAATTVGGLTAGLPGAGLLVKGLVAVLVVAPVLSTDTPFSGGVGRTETRVVSASDRGVASRSGDDVDTTEAIAALPTSSAAIDPAPATSVEPEVTVEPEPDSGGSGAGERPSAVSDTTVPAPSLTVPLVPNQPLPSLPSASLPPLPDVVDAVVDDVLQPIVGGVTEPVVETLDEALATMGLGTTGETVAMLRSLVPILDGPLLGPVVDALLGLTSIGNGTTDSAGGAGPDQGAGGGREGDPPPPSDAGGEPSPGVLPVEIPSIELPGTPSGDSAPVSTPTVAVTIPAISIPVMSTPAISPPPIVAPQISVPPISIPLLNLPVITLPVIIPPITLPNILG